MDLGIANQSRFVWLIGLGEEGGVSPVRSMTVSDTGGASVLHETCVEAV